MSSSHFIGSIRHIPGLIKIKLSSWVTLTSFSGYCLSSNWDLQSAIALGVGIFCCSASSQAANQLIETKTDSMMKRTSKRPLVTGNMSRRQAIVTCAAFAAAGTSILGYVSPLSAVMGFGNILAYALIYTPLKYKTKYNTHIGAIVGALPPLIGSTMSNIELNESSPWVLFYALYAWQMPHFYLIAWLNRKDCLKVGFRMTGINDDSGKTTGKACLRWHSLSLFISSLLVAENVRNSMDINYSSFIPLVLNLSMMKPFIDFMRSSTSISAIRLFNRGLWHILALLASISYTMNNNKTIKHNL